MMPDFKKRISDMGFSEKDGKRIEVMVYFEFNPMDFGGKDCSMQEVEFGWLKKSFDNCCIEMCGEPINWGNFEIRKLITSVSLFWIRSLVYIDNPFI